MSRAYELSLQLCRKEEQEKVFVCTFGMPHSRGETGTYMAAFKSKLKVFLGAKLIASLQLAMHTISFNNFKAR